MMQGKDLFEAKNRIWRYKQGDDPKRRNLHASWWHRSGNNAIIPSRVNLKEVDGAMRYIVGSAHPCIDRHGKIVIIGSCFAEHLGYHLRYCGKRKVPKKKRKGIEPTYRFDHTAGNVSEVNNTAVFVMGAGHANIQVMLKQIKWALGLEEIDHNILYRSHLLSYAKEEQPSRPHTRPYAKAVIKNADAIVIAPDLSELWYDTATGETMFGSVPRGAVDTGRFKFRNTTTQENVDCLGKIKQIVRKHCGRIPIILTVSPVPLFVTCTKETAVTANSASKSILRAAIDQYLRECDDKNIFYFPALELSQEFFGPSGMMSNRRHLTMRSRIIMGNLFERCYLR